MIAFAVSEIPSSGRHEGMRPQSRNLTPSVAALAVLTESYEIASQE
jgi:hypothetical protein